MRIPLFNYRNTKRSGKPLVNSFTGDSGKWHINFIFILLNEIYMYTSKIWRLISIEKFRISSFITLVNKIYKQSVYFKKSDGIFSFKNILSRSHFMISIDPVIFNKLFHEQNSFNKDSIKILGHFIFIFYRNI